MFSKVQLLLKTLLLLSKHKGTMSEINSTLTAGINELCDVSNWMTSKIYGWLSLQNEELLSMANKIDAMQPIVEKYNRLFSADKVIVNDDLVLKLENSCSNLWNAVSITLKTEQKAVQSKKDNSILLLCKSKLFAAMLLSIHSNLIGNSFKIVCRVFHCFVNVMKAVSDFFLSDVTLNKIDDNVWNTIGDKTLEMAHSTLKLLEDQLENGDNNDILEFKKNKFELYLLNFQSSIKDRDVETAEMYLWKINIKESTSLVDPNFLLEICRITYNSASSLMKPQSGLSDSTVRKFIDIVKEIYSYLDLPIQHLRTHIDYNNIKYSLLKLLTNLMIEKYSVLNNDKECETYLNLLQNDYSKKVEPYKINIKFCKLKRAKNFEQSLNEIIMTMITSVQLKSNFTAILECIKEMVDVNSKLAIICMNYLLMNKIDQANEQEMVEKLIVTNFFTIIQAKDLTMGEIINFTKEFIEMVEKQIVHPLGKTTIACIITLLWNKAKKLDKADQVHDAISFYEFSLRKLFEPFMDVAKLKRALISDYIAEEKYDDAESLYTTMAENDQSHPLSQLLMVKVYVSKKDRNNLRKCFKTIQTSDQPNSKEILILALTYCKDFTDITLDGIKFLFELLADSEINKENPSDEVLIPALCLTRYTIQMILKLSEDEADVFSGYNDDILSLFTKASKLIERYTLKRTICFDKSEVKENLDSISLNEIEWFCSAAYNISVKCYIDSITKNLLELSKFNIDLIKYIPLDDFTFSKMFHYYYWIQKSYILNLLILKKEFDETRNNEYLERVVSTGWERIKDIEAFKWNQEYMEQIDDNESEKLKNCLTDYCSILFESILLIRNKMQLLELLTLIESFNHVDIFKIVFDVLVQTEDIPKGLQKDVMFSIITSNMFKEKIDNITSVKWCRLFLENDAEFDINLERQAITALMKRLKIDLANSTRSNKFDTFKQDVEMISTLSWNRGINAVIVMENDAVIFWCKISIEFASFVNVGLKEQLKQLWTSLSERTNIQCEGMDLL